MAHYVRYIVIIKLILLESILATGILKVLVKSTVICILLVIVFSFSIDRVNVITTIISEFCIKNSYNLEDLEAIE